MIVRGGEVVPVRWRLLQEATEMVRRHQTEGGQRRPWPPDRIRASAEACETGELLLPT